ncbi:cytochrome c oxidase subunit II [Anabaena sp. FACHB-1237]|uniref:cytochrome c oxidase subunit II n=1 Tax=Anabaena sp. FACHB-1237 TaxID=2692769 RepID=UPI0016801CD0|nr:cytochrome c oxidase subunit II [Anabaena sp. FACHB-1237]MBD2137898.1 cytochrome c oxidase subunit II [Anabaena sp. FACHB-1237]
MKIPRSIWTLLIGIVLTLASLWYGQNNGLMPVAASDEAVLVDGLFNSMVTVSFGIFVIVESVLIYSAFKYRRRPGDNEDGPHIEGNIPLEILWTAIPAIIVLGISVYSFEVYNASGGFDPHGGHDAPIMAQLSSLKPDTMAAMPMSTSHNSHSHSPGATLIQSEEDQPAEYTADLNISVSAMQYAWLFTYNDTGITTGELHLPIGKTVEISMTASDVIHAFWIPEFRMKQDAIPGRESKFRFTPRKPGDYEVICAELCGPYHGVMKTPVVVEAQADFDKWMQEQLVANKDHLNETVAMNPSDMTADQFLAPYIKDMGINTQSLHQLHQ